MIWYERKFGFKFEFVVSTREDIYFFHPMDLGFLTQLLPVSNSSSNCHIISKGCLENGGINMRLQLMSRADALKVLGGRFPFYHALYGLNRSYKNPEQFELAQVSSVVTKF